MKWIINPLRESSLGAQLVTVILLCTTLPVMIVYFLGIKQGVDNGLNTTRSHLESTGMELQTRFTALSEALRAFRGTPPAEGIVRAKENGGIDPVDQSSLATWQDRFNTIALVFLKNFPYISRLEVVYQDNELLIKAQRSGQGAVAANSDELKSGVFKPDADRELLRSVLTANDLDPTAPAGVAFASTVRLGDSMTSQLAIPIQLGTDKIKGTKAAIILSVDPQVFFGILATTMPLDSGTEWIVDSRGKVVFERASGQTAWAIPETSDSELPFSLPAQSSAQLRLGHSSVESLGEYFFATSPGVFNTDFSKSKYWFHAYRIKATALYWHAFVDTLWLFGLMIASLAAALLVGMMFSRRTSGNLTNFIEGAREESIAMAGLTTQLSESSLAISATSQSQASSVEETASSVEELESMVKSNAQSSKSVAELAKQAKSLAVSGSEAMGELATSIQVVAETSGRLDDFNKVFSNITTKTKLIDEIVSQTRLLSFNASIEAARAGEHGKGFAVVAEEIGNLAQLSGSAAKEISEILGQSVESLQSVIRDIDESVSRSNASSSRTTEAFQNITTDVGKVANLVDEIAEANNEQWKGLRQISQAMHAIDQSTQENAAAAVQLDQTIRTLDQEAARLTKGVDNLACIILGAKHCALTLKSQSSSESNEARNTSAAQDSTSSSKQLRNKTSRIVAADPVAVSAKPDPSIKEVVPNQFHQASQIPDDDELFEKAS